MAKSRLGAMPLPVSRQLVDAIYLRASELAALLRDKPSVEKPTVFLHWISARVDEWRRQHGQPWMTHFSPTSLHHKSVLRSMGDDLPIVTSGVAVDISHLMERYRQTADSAVLDSGAIQSIFIELHVRNTFYPATIKDFTTFLDELEGVLGHEILHAHQTLGIRRDAQRRKAEPFILANTPFDCDSELSAPTPPHVVPCFKMVKGKNVRYGYGIPVEQATQWPDETVAVAAMRHYLYGREERTPWAYSVASSLVAAGLRTIPAIPFGPGTEAHQQASRELRQYAGTLDWSNRNDVRLWIEIRQRALVFMRQLWNAIDGVERKESRYMVAKRVREARQALMRGVQQQEAPAPRLTAGTRFIELD